MYIRLYFTFSLALLINIAFDPNLIKERSPYKNPPRVSAPNLHLVFCFRDSLCRNPNKIKHLLRRYWTIFRSWNELRM